jgi:hypothetical protein
VYGNEAIPAVNGVRPLRASVLLMMAGVRVNMHYVDAYQTKQFCQLLLTIYVL